MYRVDLFEDLKQEIQNDQTHDLYNKWNMLNVAVKEELEQASLKLAHDASRYTISVWVDSAERSNYNR